MGRSGAPAGRGPGGGRPGAPAAAERVYDPRREARRAKARVALPDDVTPEMLDQEVRRALLTLSRETADLVARHLVMTGRLLDEDPEQALVHARAAGALAGRVAVVREAAGLAAYTAGEWAEALSELRAYRRMSGSPEHLPVLADCERALGRPERALAALDDPDVPRLEQATRVELVIVVAGARRDLGQPDAAVLLLQGPARATTAKRPWAARLWYAYADALLDAGRAEEARAWFEKTADVDTDGETDAVERLLELDGVLFDDDEADDDAGDGEEPLDAEGLRDLVADVRPVETGSAVAGPVDGPGDSDGATTGSVEAADAGGADAGGADAGGADAGGADAGGADAGGADAGGADAGGADAGGADAGGADAGGAEAVGGDGAPAGSAAPPAETTATSPFSDRLEAQPMAVRPAAVPSVTFVPAETDTQDED